MGPTLGMGDQSGGSRDLVQVEPGVDGVGVARLQQTEPGDPMRRFTLGDLQQRRPTLADVGAWIVVA
jgi:hypothetical protein